MGEAGWCFSNATRAVLKYPQRLAYVEGFVMFSIAPATVLISHGRLNETNDAPLGVLVPATSPLVKVAKAAAAQAAGASK